MHPIRWTIVVVLLVLLVGLLVFARGREHRRGDEVGSHAAPASDVAIA